MMSEANQALRNQLNPRFTMSDSGADARYVDRCNADLLKAMRANPEGFTIELAFVDKMKSLYLHPELRRNAAIPHSYASKRFGRALQPIHHVPNNGQTIESDWGMQHSYSKLAWIEAGKQVKRAPAPPLTADHLWAKLLLGTYALAPRFDLGEELDCLLVDIDFTRVDGGKELSLLHLPEAKRSLVMETVRSAVTKTEEEVGVGLFPHWMASGGMGCWLHLFFTGLASRACLGFLLERIKGNLPAEAGDFRLTVDGNNLQATGCRVPLSRHVHTEEQAVFLNPENWQPYEDQIGYLLEITRTTEPRPLEEYLHSSSPSKNWGEDSPAGSKGDIPPHPPNCLVHVFDGPRIRWTVDEVIERAQPGGNSALTTWEQFIPAEIPEGRSYKLLILEGKLAQTLAAMQGQGLLDASRPLETCPTEELLSLIESRMTGPSCRLQERRAQVTDWLQCTLRQM